jgi:hypothetical protein
MNVRTRCSDAASRVSSVGVSGDAIAYPSCDDGTDSAGVRSAVVRDMANASQREVYEGAGFGVQIAGRYLAWLENPQISGEAPFAHRYDVVVYDRVGREVAYRVPASATGGGVYNLDVQDDGKLAVAVARRSKGGGFRARIAWASPQSPSLHVLPVKPMTNYTVRIAKDTIAFQRGNAPEDYVSRAEVGVTSLDGSTRIIARDSEAGLRYRGFDFDGSRLAWWAYGCRRARIEVVSATAAARGRAPRAGCRLTFRKRPRVLGRRLRLYVDCFGFYSCAVAQATVLTAEGRRRSIAEGRGDRIRLTRFGRAAVKRGALRVRVEATIVDVAGRRERRVTRAVLRGTRP